MGAEQDWQSEPRKTDTERLIDMAVGAAVCGGLGFLIVASALMFGRWQ